MEKEEKILKRRSLPEKEFKIRESILTIVFRDKNMKSVHNLMICVLLFLTITNAINDYYYDGGSQLGFRLIYLAFKGIPIALITWIFLFLIHLAVYWSWKLWATYRHSNKVWHAFWSCAAFTAFFGTFHYAAHIGFDYKLGIASQSIILGEQTRFIMKGYAFIRTNTKDIYVKKDAFVWPRFSHFLYFSFAPTLIYRSEYPRLPSTDWTKIWKFLIEFLIGTYLLSLVENKYFIEPISNFGAQPFTGIDVIYIWLSNTIIGSFWLIIFTQFIVLHASQNIFAELLKFGDREFAKDWWTVTDAGSFHTHWNVLIQDWLYTYVYKDVYEHVFLGNKAMARTAVFFLSMVLHEVLVLYIVEITLPIFLIGMAFSIVLITMPLRNFKLNFPQILNNLLGMSMIVTLIHLEYYAKRNCPNRPQGLMYVPRLFSCKH